MGVARVGGMGKWCVGRARVSAREWRDWETGGRGRGSRRDRYRQTERHTDTSVMEDAAGWRRVCWTLELELELGLARWRAATATTTTTGNNNGNAPTTTADEGELSDADRAAHGVCIAGSTVGGGGGEHSRWRLASFSRSVRARQSVPGWRAGWGGGRAGEWAAGHAYRPSAHACQSPAALPPTAVAARHHCTIAPLHRCTAARRRARHAALG